jgi:hypothetical protein
MSPIACGWLVLSLSFLIQSGPKGVFVNKVYTSSRGSLFCLNASALAKASSHLLVNIVFKRYVVIDELYVCGKIEFIHKLGGSAILRKKFLV